MDNQKCVKFCLGKGLRYAGIEFGTECEFELSFHSARFVDMFADHDFAQATAATRSAPRPARRGSSVRC